MKQKLAIVIPAEFSDRWLVCRKTPNGLTTVETDCPTEEAAELAAKTV